MDVTAHLQQVIDLNSQTTIIYHGGSTPGSARRISPIEIKEGTLVARCHESNARKTFKLDKIELATSQEIFPYSPPEDRTAWSFAEHLAVHIQAIEVAGWHIEKTDDSLSVYRFFKNGKPRKTPFASIWFSEFTAEGGWDMEAMQPTQTEKPSTSPWKVSVGESATRSFKHLDRAVAAFIADLQASGVTPHP